MDLTYGFTSPVRCLANSSNRGRKEVPRQSPGPAGLPTVALLPAARPHRRQVLPRLLIVERREGGRGVGQGPRGWPSGRSPARQCWSLGSLFLFKAALLSLGSGIPQERMGMWTTRRWARRKGLKCGLWGEGGGHVDMDPREKKVEKNPQSL